MIKPNEKIDFVEMHRNSETHTLIRLADITSITLDYSSNVLQLTIKNLLNEKFRTTFEPKSQEQKLRKLINIF